MSVQVHVKSLLPCLRLAQKTLISTTAFPMSISAMNMDVDVIVGMELMPLPHAHSKLTMDTDCINTISSTMVIH